MITATALDEGEANDLMIENYNCFALLRFSAVFPGACFLALLNDQELK
jgi:hypothetical protein